MSEQAADQPHPRGQATALRLLIATSNPGKVREFRRMLAGSGFDVVTPHEVDCLLDVEEDGDTYAANATLKAVAYARATGLLALADDSGIEVDALDGRPGIYSARYGGAGLDDAGRTALLLSELEGVPDARRTARYVAVIAIAEPADAQGAESPVRLFEGVQEGSIGHAPRGSNGFGYDPVFLVDGELTQAELSEETKDLISHRGKALRAAGEHLRARYG